MIPLSTQKGFPEMDSLCGLALPLFLLLDLGGSVTHVK